jgi:hypothetical protein
VYRVLDPVKYRLDSSFKFELSQLEECKCHVESDVENSSGIDC